MVFPIAGGNESKGYEISNSLRFNDGDSAKLGLAFGSGGNTKTWTVSCWFKRGIISSRQSFLNVGSSGSEYMSLYIDSDDKLYWVTESGGNTYRIGSSALFRDPSAWYHIVFRQDTTDGTANNRFRYYINGAEVDTGAFNAQPTQNFDGKIGGNDTHYIGSNRDGDGEFMDGYLTEYHYLDGISYDPTYFGEFDDNGVWIPKKYTGSYGTKGFFLEFQQTGTSANSSGIGADTSGNDNHFAVTNLAATDITEDTCTNNFCTWNPLDKHSGQALSEGNTKNVAANGASSCNSNFGVSQGKWYFEYKVTVVNNQAVFAVPQNLYPGGTGLFSKNYTTGLYASNPSIYRNGSNVLSNLNGTISANDIIMWAMDLDNNNIYFGKGGSWTDGNGFDQSDFSNATAYALTRDSNDSFVVISTTNGASASSYTLEMNWGNPAFAISSGNSDANGYGNFEYAPPSGYYAICTKNLAEFG